MVVQRSNSRYEIYNILQELKIMDDVKDCICRLFILAVAFEKIGMHEENWRRETS